ncbi:uncharacterized protein PV06_05647 [Exophiala oligosperma]|uniref:Metallo-beta-lactamase domain-containing protein n=1 Tax=Exophiala oligosperma TaxID=215243 RepID=A0A0D2BX53_9EURO|nr:uncharacterized protein PV06_05647 [Exophiala oligosperma]KIW42062.1 hypothetical protein PV06_05647 [Exophiala oligosperma]
MSTTKDPPRRPAHHANDYRTKFINPWPSAGAPTWGELLQASFPLSTYGVDLRKHHKARDMRVVKPDWGKASLTKQDLSKENAIIGTWLGHAGVMVEIPSLAPSPEAKSTWLLFDPIFSTRAGPTPYRGVARMKKSPCQVEDLPGCDAVFISHNHYDHLDWPTIQAITQKFPGAKYFVPLGNKQWMLSGGIPDKQIYELDWWQECEFGTSDFNAQRDEEFVLRVSCVPAQHNSGRSVTDQGCTLWCGWVVERFIASKDEPVSSTSKEARRGAIYHAGDTGYRRITKSETVCPAFKEIGGKFGPFDLSFVPIWRGGTLGFISYIGLRLSHHDVPSASHGSPADAIAIHCDVKSRNTVGIHFGTFVGSDNESYEAMIELSLACDEQGVGSLDGSSNEGQNGGAGTLDIGESLAVAIS